MWKKIIENCFARGFHCSSLKLQSPQRPPAHLLICDLSLHHIRREKASSVVWSLSRSGSLRERSSEPAAGFLLIWVGGQPHLLTGTWVPEGISCGSDTATRRGRRNSHLHTAGPRRLLRRVVCGMGHGTGPSVTSRWGLPVGWLSGISALHRWEQGGERVRHAAGGLSGSPELSSLGALP